MPCTIYCSLSPVMSCLEDPVLTGLLCPLVFHTVARLMFSNANPMMMQIRGCLTLIPPPPAAFTTTHWLHFALRTKPDFLPWSTRPCMACALPASSISSQTCLPSNSRRQPHWLSFFCHKHILLLLNTGRFSL